MSVIFCQVYSQIVQDVFLFLFCSLSCLSSCSKFFYVCNSNKPVSSRKWTHTDLSLQAQREIWSCVSLISCTTEFEGKQAEFRFVWEQCCIVVKAALSWSSKSPCCRHGMCCMNGPDCSDITKIDFFLRTANIFSICNTATKLV